MTIFALTTKLNQTQKHECGGSIAAGGEGEQAHVYCEKCAAFRYGDEATLPTGTNKAANRAAWDAGDKASPEAGQEKTK